MKPSKRARLRVRLKTALVAAGLAAAGAIIRRGLKVLIDLDRYGAWPAVQRELRQ